VGIGINKRYAMDIAAGLASDLSDEANLGLFGGIGQAKYQDFIWSEPVSRDNASAVPAQHHGFRWLRKHFSGRVRAKQDDFQFFRDASAAAFWVHGA
jgi:hypothetical protein